MRPSARAELQSDSESEEDDEDWFSQQRASARQKVGKK